MIAEPITSPMSTVADGLAEEKFHSLVEFVFPSLDVCAEKSLYFKNNREAQYNFLTKTFSFIKYGEVIFDTYFNSLSVGKFRKYSDISTMLFKLQGFGKYRVSFRLNRMGYAAKLLHELEIDVKAGHPTSVDMPFYSSMEDGILFVTLECVSGSGEITGLSFSTKEEPKHDCKLGIVITHFKRERYVVPAIKRVKEGLLQREEYKNNIDLIVVDNSITLTDEQADGAILIPNKNLGGSGGFTRGLLHLMERGDFTHCLFMDDDASCEIESIRRTYSFLQYLKDDTYSIAGSLLMENFQYMQFESGAQYKHGLVRPLKCNINLGDPGTLIYNEMDEKVHYGAWWFFAFPIKEIKHLAFPFFVRGDDITFSLQNKLNIITLNGIGTWGESFTHKIAAMERYLTMRSTLQMALVNSPSRKSKKTALKFFRKQVLHDLKSYNYDRAEVMVEAMTDVLKGKSFWLENIDMGEKRQKLNSMIQFEKNAPHPEVFKLTSAKLETKEGKFRKMVRKFSLNGHLLPKMFLRKDVYKLDRYQENTPVNTFGKVHIVYYDPYNYQGYYTHYTKKRFFKILYRFTYNYFKFKYGFKELKNECSQYKYDFMSVEFWKKIYQ
jgi:galactofuranosylgalactofuranosylrhamnosyl-N-acetylglucosaminyl-diphospho-decaprenol beta-1,5/1,6-galactofuranosyltransferase